jgi:FkbM family methyltransferase
MIRQSEKASVSGMFARLRKGLSAGEAAAAAAAIIEADPQPRAEAGWADRHSVAFVERYLRPGDSVLDVGANDGRFARAAAALIGLEGRVDAVEPSPTMRRRLAEAVRRTHGAPVLIHDRMAGDRTHLARFVDGTGKSGRRRPPLPGELGGGVIGVECVRLDGYLGNHRYSLMRLDASGMEPIVLAGAEAMLQDCNPPVMLLALDSALADFGSSPEAVAGYLAERGYECILYDADRHRLDYVAEPWLHRRMVLAVAERARNYLSQRLARTDDPQAGSTADNG